MRKQAISISCFVLVAAAFGGFVRWIQNQAAFELDTGLMIPGNTWSTVALLMCVAMLLLIVNQVRKLWYQGYYPAQSYTEIIKGDPNWLRRITRGIAALMIAGAVVAFLVAGYELYTSMVRTLCVMAVASAWAFVKLSEQPFAEKPSNGKQMLYVSIPVVMYVYWLIVSYRLHAAIPSVWSYAVEIIAISVSLLGMFYFAGYGYEFPKPYITMGCLMAGAFLSLVTLSDTRNVGQTLMLVAGAAMQLYYVWMIVDSMSEEWPEEHAEETEEANKAES